MIGMRHVVVHHYVGVDQQVVTDVLKHDLPALRAAPERELD